MVEFSSEGEEVSTERGKLSIGHPEPPGKGPQIIILPRCPSSLTGHSSLVTVISSKSNSSAVGCPCTVLIEHLRSKHKCCTSILWMHQIGCPNVKQGLEPVGDAHNSNIPLRMCNTMRLSLTRGKTPLPRSSEKGSPVSLSIKAQSCTYEMDCRATRRRPLAVQELEAPSLSLIHI